MWIDNLNLLRKKSGLDLDELSKKSGVPKGTLSKITAGITKNPGIETIKSIVYAMGYSLEDLEDNNMRKAPANVANALEKRLVDNFNRLNKDGQSMLLEFSQIMVDSKRYCKPVEVAARGGHQVSANQVDDLDDLIPPDAIHE